MRVQALNKHPYPLESNRFDLIQSIGLNAELIDQIIEMSCNHSIPDGLTCLAEMLILFLAFSAAALVQDISLVDCLLGEVVI